MPALTYPGGKSQLARQAVTSQAKIDEKTLDEITSR
jgi:hypothetical protein